MPTGAPSDQLVTMVTPDGNRPMAARHSVGREVVGHLERSDVGHVASAAPSWRSPPPRPAGVGQQPGFVDRVARPASSTRMPSIHTLWTPRAGRTGPVARRIEHRPAHSGGRCHAARNRLSCPTASEPIWPCPAPGPVHARHFEHRGRREECSSRRASRNRLAMSRAAPSMPTGMPSVPTSTLTPRSIISG